MITPEQKEKLLIGLRVVRTWLTATIITLGLAGIFSANGDAGGTAAIAAFCSAGLFTLVLFSQFQLNFISFAAFASIFFAGASAWYWIVSAQPVDTSQLQIAGSLAIALALAAFLGLFAVGVHIWIIVNRK